MYNYAMIIGRICTDIEVKQSKDGISYMTTLVAVGRPFKNPETDTYDTDFIPIVAFSGTCEFAQENIKKGDKVIVKGRLVQNNMPVSKDKEKIILQFVAERIMLS